MLDKSGSFEYISIRNSLNYFICVLEAGRSILPDRVI
jgi:hypothetical protein